MTKEHIDQLSEQLRSIPDSAYPAIERYLETLDRQSDAESRPNKRTAWEKHLSKHRYSFPDGYTWNRDELYER